MSCPNEHTLGAGQVLLGWRACGCAGARHGGHRTWTCQRCVENEVPSAQVTISATPHHEELQQPELRSDQRWGLDLSHLAPRPDAARPDNRTAARGFIRARRHSRSGTIRA